MYLHLIQSTDFYYASSHNLFVLTVLRGSYWARLNPYIFDLLLLDSASKPAEYYLLKRIKHILNMQSSEYSLTEYLCFLLHADLLSISAD